MSANDAIFINKDTFEVYHQGCADNDGLGDVIAIGKNLEDAVKKAEKYAKENCAYGYPEYGIRFV